jgi:hypothetical protein
VTQESDFFEIFLSCETHDFFSHRPRPKPRPSLSCVENSDVGLMNKLRWSLKHDRD